MAATYRPKKNWTQNTQRQFLYWATKPPTIGPTTGPRKGAREKKHVASARS